MVVTYAPTLPSLGKITRQHHHILHLSERTKQAFLQPPIIAYRRPKNLRVLLVRVDLAPHAIHPPGNTPCGRSRCKAFPALITSDRFTSHCTGKTYTLRSAATCKSKDVVYLIQCKRCGLQYVGKTEQALNETEQPSFRHKAQEHQQASGCPLQQTRLFLNRPCSSGY